MQPGLELELSMYASELRVTDANEATTRLKLIDTVIFELLGWQKDDVSVEERVSEDGSIGFIDYLIQAGPHSFVVEAKRVGRAFGTLPKARKASLSDKWAKEKPTVEALRQARDYPPDR